MLVLSRKVQESVAVGGTDGLQSMLRVTVLEIQGGRVRLGFETKADVPIHRWEVWERILAEERTDPAKDRSHAPPPIAIPRGIRK